MIASLREDLIEDTISFLRDREIGGDILLRVFIIPFSSLDVSLNTFT